MRFFVIFLLAAIAGSLSVQKHGSDTPKKDLNKLKQILSVTKEMKNEVYEFWLQYGPDYEFGGFYTEVDQFGVPTVDAPKNIVTQARQLYVAAVFILEERYPPRDKQRVIEAMTSLYEFISKYLYASHTKEFYYSVSFDGKTVVNGDQRAYFTSFAIYALSYRVMALKKLGEFQQAEESLKMAMEAYQSLHNRLYDSEFGGYVQSREGNWFYEFGTTDGRDNPEWGYGDKGSNTHMHMLESLTALYIASNDPFIKKMLEQLLDIFVNILFRDHPYLPYVTYANWTTLSPYQLDFGHNIQIAHLMQDAGEALDYSNISKELINKKALALVKNVQFFGFDRVNGGVFLSGIDKLGPISYDKVFWIQAESSLGFWRAYLTSGDHSFLDNMSDTLEFYENFLGAELGEFYWEYNLYQPITRPRGLDLNSAWKASYHNIRCLLRIIHEIEQFLGLAI
eukprot:TRINITY_DN3350_c1_g1_i2.p1 TRINITY_DN3350_c1_g1~~TRINITY_DN3350_c1_g1_i2.p1  ORF type:complete len:452 (+),score=69.10 TRINITY_DN3350_c1_g1_i2:288-1643(+)